MICEGFAIKDSVTWILVIVGWVIVNHQNNKRELRKENRQRVDSIIKLANDIELHAFQYHCEGKDDLISIKIKRGITKLSSDLKVLANFGISVRYAIYVSQIRIAITGVNFDTADYKKCQPSDKIFINIGISMDDLRFALEREYSNKYKSTDFIKRIK